MAKGAEGAASECIVLMNIALNSFNEFSDVQAYEEIHCRYQCKRVDIVLGEKRDIALNSFTWNENFSIGMSFQQVLLSNNLLYVKWKHVYYTYSI